MGLPRVKTLLANVGDLGLIPGWRKSLGVKNGNPLLIFFPGKYHGQNSLVGYSP